MNPTPAPAPRPDRSSAAPPPRIGYLLRLAHRRAHRAFAESLLPLGIEARHFGVLMHLDLCGPLSQRRLMELTGSDKSAMVRAVDDLERQGLAVRRPVPADRRTHAVEITDDGRSVTARAAVIADEVGARLLEGFDAAEQETLSALLDRFIGDESRGRLTW